MAHPSLLLVQAVLTTFIIGAIYSIYRQVKLEEVKFRLRFLMAAFWAFLVALGFHFFAEQKYFLWTSLMLEHVFAIVFFLLLGATGLLHFVERRHVRIVAAGSYALGGALMLGAAAMLLYFHVTGREYVMGHREMVIAHEVQVVILLTVTVVILRRILTTRSHLGLHTLYRNYPFGIAAALLMFAVAAHTATMGSGYTLHSHSFFESFFAIPALAIIAGYITLTYKSHIRLYGAAHVDDGKCTCFYCLAEDEGAREALTLLDNLNHVIRQVYYTPLDVGIGGREVVFSEFLERTRLRGFFKRREMELDRDKFISASLRHDYVYGLSLDILRFFNEHQELVNEAQFYHLTNFLDSVHARCPRDSDFRPHWLMLSELVRGLGGGAEEYISKLSGWGRANTFSYFEEAHPTGIPKLDEDFGGAKTHQFVLNVTKEVPSLKVLHSATVSGLRGWRNVLYVASFPVPRISKEFQGEEVYLQEGRLKVITLLKGVEDGEDGIWVIPGARSLNAAVGRCLTSFPLGTALLVIDFTPIIISEGLKEFQELLNGLIEISCRERIVVLGSVSQNVQPLAMDILRERADVVVHHEVVAGDLSSVVVKPVIRAGRPLEKDLFTLLRFVYEENTGGRKPSISEISSRLSVTPKTAKKRVALLRERGLATIELVGRYKVVELTERGRQAFLRGRRPAHE